MTPQVTPPTATISTHDVPADLLPTQGRSEALFEQARQVIPGGVNSPVRAFRAVGGSPRFIKRAEGAYLIDEDGRRYIELINSWGPMVLGHAHPAIREAVSEAMSGGFSFGAPTAREVEMAETICRLVPSIEKVRMVNSGTEATMSAIRLARGITGRDRIIKFEGCYHGHGDSFLIAAGSGAATFGVPDSPGVPKALAALTLVARYNDLAHVQALFDQHGHDIACLIIEPVAGNMGLVAPAEGFLEGLRALCDQYGALLIYDEVMTGFRLSLAGAQGIYPSVTPDLTTLGKIIGGGLPVGAYGGRRELMDYVSPSGPVYQAGTLSGNPLAMAAGLAMLNMLEREADTIYPTLEANGARMAEALSTAAAEAGVALTLNRVGSMLTGFFHEGPVTTWAEAKQSDTARFGKFFHAMLERGVYLAPSQFEALFVSTALSGGDFDQFSAASRQAMQEIVR